MQEGQRIGRVQRPQPGKDTAYFYSLVCDETQEEEFAYRRQKFLLNHGYSVHVARGSSRSLDCFHPWLLACST